MGSFVIKILFFSVALCLIASLESAEEEFTCTAEQHRPRYHFSAKKNWINDPNGMVYVNGTYHLFYQHNPNSMNAGTIHWGHAISKDLISWEELAIALAPDDLGAIFSGSAVVDYKNTAGFKKNAGDQDPVVAIYTNAGGDNYEIQSQSIAYSLDGGLSFTKYEANPVLSDDDSPDFRDPKVFYHIDRWIMSLAVRNRIEFYSSPNLKTWTKESDFGSDPVEGNHDGVWECPDLVQLTVAVSDSETIDLWVLLVSINPGGPNKGSATQYFIGSFTNESGFKFTTYPWSENQWLDWGPDNYAGVTFSNDSSRKVYMAWMSNWDYADKTPNLAHRGQMTIPRELGLRVLNLAENQYRLTSHPAQELTKLRNPNHALEQNEPIPVNPQSIIQLTENLDFDTTTIELEVNLEMEISSQFSICAYNDVDEEICFGFNSTHWFIDRSRSGNVSFSENFKQTLQAYAFREITDKETSIRIFLDVSSIEVFADDGLTTMTALHFPSKPFGKFYINHWSNASSNSTVIVKNFKVYGLDCWFSEKSSVSSLYANLAVVLAALLFALRHI